MSKKLNILNSTTVFAGYPTAVHMAKVNQLGASPIHSRRSFAPLKHMDFDGKGNVIENDAN